MRKDRKRRERLTKLKDRRSRIKEASNDMLAFFKRVCDTAGCTEIEQLIFTIRVLSAESKKLVWDEEDVVKKAIDRFPEYITQLRKDGTAGFLTSAWRKIIECKTDDEEVKEFQQAMRQGTAINASGFLANGQHRLKVPVGETDGTDL